jgi:hypothetical protein
MKSLSSALAAALAAPVQRPALLVEIAFSGMVRWTSADTLTWNGYTWSPRNIRLDGLQTGPLQVSGTLVIGNADDEIGTLVLSQGVQDRAVRIWAYDAAATSAGDVVWLADAVAAGGQVSASEVRIPLRHKADLLYSPQTYINEAAGFTQLMPGGTVLRINGVDMRLERRA